MRQTSQYQSSTSTDSFEGEPSLLISSVKKSNRIAKPQQFRSPKFFQSIIDSS